MKSDNESHMALQTQSRRVQTFVTALLWCLTTLLVLERFGWIAVELGKRSEVAGIGSRLSVQLGSAFGECFYLAALYWIRSALASMASGELFAPILTQMLRRVGLCLVAGTVAEVAVVPTIERLLGVGPGYWIAFDITGCTLGAVGLSFTLLARVLDRASKLKTELDGIF